MCADTSDIDWMERICNTSVMRELMCLAHTVANTHYTSIWKDSVGERETLVITTTAIILV